MLIDAFILTLLSEGPKAYHEHYVNNIQPRLNEDLEDIQLELEIINKKSAPSSVPVSQPPVVKGTD